MIVSESETFFGLITFSKLPAVNPIKNDYDHSFGAAPSFSPDKSGKVKLFMSNVILLAQHGRTFAKRYMYTAIFFLWLFVAALLCLFIAGRGRIRKHQIRIGFGAIVLSYLFGLTILAVLLITGS
jgi:hypothetical protein